LVHGLADDGVDDFDVFAGGDFGEDAALLGVEVGLAGDDVAEDGDAVFDDGSGRFVAGGLDG
jgi:hypothetical protein